MRYYFNKLLFSVLLLVVIPWTGYTQEVCLSSSHAADLIALLEASEQDIILLERCNSLVQELEEAIEIRDKRIVKLANSLIKANTEVIEYKRKYENSTEYLKYSLGANVFFTLLIILPLL